MFLVIDNHAHAHARTHTHARAHTHTHTHTYIYIYIPLFYFTLNLWNGITYLQVVQINYQQETIRLKEELDKSKSELEYFIQGNGDVGELRMDLDVVLQENRRLTLENSRLSKYVRELDKVNKAWV